MLDLEQQAATLEAAGSWAIVRKGKRDIPPRVKRFKQEAQARDAWDQLDVREGWAVLLTPEGKTVERQSGPWAVRRVW